MTKREAYEQFAMWLRAHHPALFAQLQSTSTTLGRLHALYRGPTFATRARHSLGDYADYFGAASDAVAYTADIPDITLDQIDVSAPALGDEGSSLEQDIASETAGAASLTPTVSTADTVPTAAPVAATPAASSIASALASNAGLITATLNAANTVVTSKAAAQLIQAQANRAAAGLAPADVGYATVTDEATGAVSAVPVLNTVNGQLPLSTAGIDALSPSTFLQNYGLYIMLGLAALVVAVE